MITYANLVMEYFRCPLITTMSQTVNLSRLPLSSHTPSYLVSTSDYFPALDTKSNRPTGEQSLSMLYLIMYMLENLRPIPKGLTNPLSADLARFEKLPSDVMNNILVQLDVESFRSFRNVNAKAHTSTRNTY